MFYSWEQYYFEKTLWLWEAYTNKNYIEIRSMKISDSVHAKARSANWTTHGPNPSAACFPKSCFIEAQPGSLICILNRSVFSTTIAELYLQEGLYGLQSLKYMLSLYRKSVPTSVLGTVYFRYHSPLCLISIF